MIFVLNPYRYEKRFYQKQQAIKASLVHIDIDNSSLRNEAIQSFNRALKDPPQGLSEAFEKLSLAYHSKEDDYEIMSYLGRTTVLLVAHRIVTSPLAFLVYDTKGFNWLDKAVAHDPDNINVRFNRAMTSMVVSPLLDRDKIAKIDFEYLVENKFNNSSADISIKEQVVLNLEKLYAKEKANMVVE